MQILPETAYYLAQLSGGQALHRHRPRDPDDQRRLRQLLPALPARPLRRQRDARARRLQRRARRTSTAGSRTRAQPGEPLTIGAIPFPETREYVQRVLAAQQAYREHLPARARARLARGSSAAPSCRTAGAGRERTAGRSRYRSPVPAFKLDTVFTPDRRPAAGDRVAGRGDRRRRALPDAARARPAPARR